MKNQKSKSKNKKVINHCLHDPSVILPEAKFMTNEKVIKQSILSTKEDCDFVYEVFTLNQGKD